MRFRQLVECEKSDNSPARLLNRIRPFAPPSTMIALVCQSSFPTVCSTIECSTTRSLPPMTASTESGEARTLHRVTLAVLLDPNLLVPPTVNRDRVRHEVLRPAHIDQHVLRLITRVRDLREPQRHIVRCDHQPTNPEVHVLVHTLLVDALLSGRSRSSTGEERPARRRRHRRPRYGLWQSASLVVVVVDDVEVLGGTSSPPPERAISRRRVSRRLRSPPPPRRAVAPRGFRCGSASLPIAICDIGLREAT